MRSIVRLSYGLKIVATAVVAATLTNGAIAESIVVGGSDCVRAYGADPWECTDPARLYPGAYISQRWAGFLPSNWSASAPIGTFPVMIWIHGGAWSSAVGIDTEFGFARDMARRGFVVLVPEYTRTTYNVAPTQAQLINPAPVNPQPFSLGYDDINSFVSTVRNYSVAISDYRYDVNRISIGGISSGSNVALKQAVRINQGGTFKCLIGYGVVANPSMLLNYGNNYALGRWAVVSAFGADVAAGDMFRAAIVNSTEGAMTSTSPLAQYSAQKTYLLHGYRDNSYPWPLVRSLSEDLAMFGKNVVLEMGNEFNPGYDPLSTQNPLPLPNSASQLNHAISELGSGALSRILNFMSANCV